MVLFPYLPSVLSLFRINLGFYPVATSKRISLKKLAQKVEESKVASSATKSTLAVKGFVIGEKRPRDEVPNILPSEAGSKGKEAMPLPEARKKAKSTAMPSATPRMGAIHSVAVGEGTSANPVAP